MKSKRAGIGGLCAMRLTNAVINWLGVRVYRSKRCKEPVVARVEWSCVDEVR